MGCLLGCVLLGAGSSLASGLPATQPTTRAATQPAVQTLPPAEAERVRGLIRRLGHADPDLRQAALDALHEVGRGAVPYLVEGLASPSAGVRAGCAKALGWVGGAEALRPLSRRLLGDEVAVVRVRAAHALGALGWVGALPALAESLRDTEPAVRAEAALSIGQAVRIARTRRPLRAEERVLVRAAVTPLIDALGDRQAAVRGNAAISLGVLRDPRALAPLALATLDGDPLVRASVCHGLADLGRRGAGGALVLLLDDADVTVRRSAIEALTRITGRTLGYRPRDPAAERRQAIQRWQTWWQRTRRQLEKESQP